MDQAVGKQNSNIKAVCFDFMGTCLDWHSSVTSSLPKELDEKRKSTFALEWRQAYFDRNSRSLSEGRPIEDFDKTLRLTLDDYVEKHDDIKHLFTEEIKVQAVASFHNQKAWGEVAEAIRKLKHELGLEVFVHANGSTRLQLDLINSSGLKFDMLFSSELLGVLKPAPENYERMLKLIERDASQVVTVAAHAYDVRGAKALGMKTVYIYRWTDDIHEDQAQVRRENDAYLEDMTTLDSTIRNL